MEASVSRFIIAIALGLVLTGCVSVSKTSVESGAASPIRHMTASGNMACIGASSARALELAFGTDAVSFTVLWKGNTVGTVTNPDVQRAYTSFSQLGLQEADSRIWGGIHFRFDSDASLEMCPKAVDYAYERRMRPLH